MREHKRQYNGLPNEMHDPCAGHASESISDIENHFDLLKSSIQSRLKRIQEVESASQKQELLLQNRMEGLYDREQEILAREAAVLHQEQQVHAEQGRLIQLQSELQQQYVCLMTSLPLLQQRLHAAHTSLPEHAAAADDLDKSHASLAVSSHQLLKPQSGGAAAQPDQSEPQETTFHQPMGTAMEEEDKKPRGNGRRDPSKMPTHERVPAEAQMQGFQTPQTQQHPAPVPSAKTAAVPVHVPNGYTDPHPFCPTASAPSAVLGAGANGAFQPDLATAVHMPSIKGDLQAAPNLQAAIAGQVATSDNSKKPTSEPAQGQTTQAATDPDLLNNSKSAQPHVLNGALPKFKVTVPDSKHGASSAAGRPLNQASSAVVGGSSEVAASVTVLGSPKASGNLEGQPAWKSSIEVGSPTSSSRGRGRFFGRNRRGRGRSHLSRPDDQCSTGDLDEAVQALKATTGGNDSPTSNADNLHASGALTDDDLKPAFMRRSASDKLHHPDGAMAAEDAQLMDVAQARQAGVDMNPRPMARRRLDPAATARKAAATAVLKREAPDLLELLQQKGLADEVDMLDAISNAAQEDQQQASSVYVRMHAILSKLCEGKAGSSWQGRGLNAGKVVGADGVESKHEYCLLALEHLVERAQAYSSNAEPVTWGWCRELTSFVFIFGSANRIVVEKPNYGHATYFFDLEEPLPVIDQVPQEYATESRGLRSVRPKPDDSLHALQPSVVAQVKRLIAVLSVPGVSRRKLLEGSSLDPGPDVTIQERKQLEAAGWSPGTTIRSLLNFSGDRIFHQSADIMTGQKFAQQYAPDYKEKIARVLSEGASGGRISKTARPGQP